MINTFSHCFRSNTSLKKIQIQCMGVLFLITALFLVSFQTKNAMAGAGMRMLVSPAATTKAVGQSFSVSILIDTDAPVSSFQFNFSYDPALLNLKSVTLGSAVSSWFSAINPNNAGVVSVGAFNMNALSQGSNLEFAVLNFVVKDPGKGAKTGSLILSKALLDRYSLTPSQLIPGLFTLSPVMEAPVIVTKGK